jgi:hypothetical protein
MASSLWVWFSARLNGAYIRFRFFQDSRVLKEALWVSCIINCPARTNTGLRSKHRNTVLWRQALPPAERSWQCQKAEERAEKRNQTAGQACKPRASKRSGGYREIFENAGFGPNRRGPKSGALWARVCKNFGVLCVQIEADKGCQGKVWAVWLRYFGRHTVVVLRIHCGSNGCQELVERDLVSMG